MSAQLADPVLDALFAGATRYEIIDDSRTGGGRVVVSRSSPADLGALRAALALTPGDAGYCMCAGDATLRVTGPDGVRAQIGLHHGTSLRCRELWPTDRGLAAPEKLVDLFAALGWRRYRDEFDERDARVRDDGAAETQWRAAIPDALRPFEADLVRQDGNVPPAVLESAGKTLLAAHGSDAAAVRVLLGWYGSGSWPRHPMYEAIARTLLVAFGTPALLGALDADLAPRQLDGAARFVASSDFRRERKKVPRTVLDRLHAHVTGRQDSDFIKTFEAAFSKVLRKGKES